MDPSVLLNLEKLKKLLDSKKDVISQQMTITNAANPRPGASGQMRPVYETITTDLSGTRILSHTQNNHHNVTHHVQPSSGSFGLPNPITFVHSAPISQASSQIVRGPRLYNK